MKKSKNITKYDINWQILRSQIKGPKTPLIDKLSRVRSFWKLNRTIDSWERIVNWLEGLRMGYIASKNQEAIRLIDNETKKYQSEKNNLEKEEQKDRGNHKETIQNYSFKERLNLWKDLFKRNQKWLERGYFHNEHNQFMDLLYDVFVEMGEESKLPDNYSFKKLKNMREDGIKKKNTHKFFF